MDNYLTIKNNKTLMTTNTIIGSRNVHFDNKARKNAMEESIRSSRYKLNQYYLHKFHEDRIKSQRTNNPSYLNHFAQDSFLLEKMVNLSRNPTTENMNTEAQYDFQRNLYDNQYHERLRSFNEKRSISSNERRKHNNCSNNEECHTSNYDNQNQQCQYYQQYQEKQQEQQSDQSKTMTSSRNYEYKKSNLSTYVPRRKIKINTQCQYNFNYPYNNIKSFSFI